MTKIRVVIADDHPIFRHQISHKNEYMYSCKLSISPLVLTHL